MRRKRLPLILMLTVLAAAAAYGVLALSARPAATHAFFSGEKPGTQVIAHRGGSHLRPENTLAAFAHAVEIGADVLDTDVRRTADGAIVCLHDATVERTTEGSGRAESFRLEELQRLDAGYRWSADGGQSFPFRGKGIRVPALGEVLARFPGARMVIEMKNGDTAFAQSFCALIRGSGMAEKVLVASMQAEGLAAFRDACPEVATSMSGREARTFIGLSRVGLTAAYSPAVAALQIPDRLGENVIATEGLAADARRRGLKLHVWTVNDENRMRQLVQIGVEGIFTDRPDVLLRLLGRGRRCMFGDGPNIPYPCGPSLG